MTRWRRRRDSNPRDPFGSNGFQDRRFQPLTHSSAFNSIAVTLSFSPQDLVRSDHHNPVVVVIR